MHLQQWYYLSFSFCVFESWCVGWYRSLLASTELWTRAIRICMVEKYYMRSLFARITWELTVWIPKSRGSISTRDLSLRVAPIYPLRGHSDITFKQINAQHGANIPGKQTNNTKIQLSLAHNVTTNNICSNIFTKTTISTDLTG